MPIHGVRKQRVSMMYLSYDTMVSLGIVNKDSLKLVNLLQKTNPSHPLQMPTTLWARFAVQCCAMLDDGKTCACPRRDPVQLLPTSLPFFVLQRTMADAWNGYHSVPLRESDRHLTTFIIPFGRWHYTRAPQGFLSLGDGYNRRFDATISLLNSTKRNG